MRADSNGYLRKEEPQVAICRGAQYENRVQLAPEHFQEVTKAVTCPIVHPGARDFSHILAIHRRLWTMDYQDKLDQHVVLFGALLLSSQIERSQTLNTAESQSQS